MSEVQGNPLNALLARVPAVERVMSSVAVQPLLAEYGRTQVLAAVRAALDRLRQNLQAGAPVNSACNESHVVSQVAILLAQRAQSRLRAVFNLTVRCCPTRPCAPLLKRSRVR